MPATKKQPAAAKGRPKRGNPPRKVMTLRIDIAYIDWMYQNLTRSTPISDFVNESIGARIEAQRRRPAKSH